MASTFFGYLLGMADISLLTTAYVLLYIAYRNTSEKNEYTDYLVSLKSGPDLEVISSNTSVNHGQETRISA